MVLLTRTVRFCINPSGSPETSGTGHNTFAAHPSMRGLGRFYEFEVHCLGRVNPATGYFVNIKVIDNAVRSVAVPGIQRACTERPDANPAAVLGDLLAPLNKALGGSIRSVRWKLTPYYSVEMSPTNPTTALLRQQFEFAASHRLHVPAMSDEENRRVFGKCNNPRGHGHNYRVEPCVEVEVGPGARPFDLADLERLTAEAVIDRFDHMHLNEDTPEFNALRSGLNPSVENIAKTCFDLLAPAVQKAAPAGNARLRSITVWETDKTSCTYPA